jgi:type IV secretion system protein TrbL
MSTRSHRIVARGLVVGALAAAMVLSPPQTGRAQANPINPCDWGPVGAVCDPVGTVSSAANDAFTGIVHDTVDSAAWALTGIGSVMNATTTPNLTSGWFPAQYHRMVVIAGELALLLLALAVIQAMIRQDWWMLFRAAFGYLPLAFVFAGAAMVVTQLLVSVTDDLCGQFARGIGHGSDPNNFLGSIGNSLKQSMQQGGQDGNLPLVALLLSSIVVLIGSLVLWIELVIREAAIYVAAVFLPLSFVAMIWEAAGHAVRRLAEVLVAAILSKLVIVVILVMATAALVSLNVSAPATIPGDPGIATAPSSNSHFFGQLIVGMAILILAALSPVALLRLIPAVEAHAVTSANLRSHMPTPSAGHGGSASPAQSIRQTADAHWYGSGQAPRTTDAPADAEGGQPNYRRSTASEPIAGEPSQGVRAETEIIRPTSDSPRSVSSPGTDSQPARPRGDSEGGRTGDGEL